MMYLLFSVLITTILFVVFKLFAIYKVDTFQAIVVNYIVAFAFGLFTSQTTLNMAYLPNKPWFIGAVILGVLFISIFNVMGLTAQRNGVTVVSVASKMSLVIPVVIGFLLFNEQLGVFKIAGVFCALFAVYFVAQRNQTNIAANKSMLLPLLLFLGSGVLDALLNYIQVHYVPPNEIALYSATIFLSAGILGVLILTIKVINKSTALTFKNSIAGIILGIPNFYSIYFLLKALEVATIEKSILFTINNVAVVLLATLVGLLLFKERLIFKNYIGIALAMLAIFFVLNKG